jgi:periodic tryptophan protein 2
LDGVLDFLNSKNMTSAGPLDLIDDDDSDEEDGTDQQSQKRLGFGLPGTGSNKARPVVRTKSLQLCPTGRSFAAATTEGLLLYSMDDNLVFDPADFDIDVTPEVISSFLHFHRLCNAAASLIC